MNILFLAIPITFALGTFFVISFFWAVSQGLFDDLETPAHRILFDDNDDPTQEKK